MFASKPMELGGGSGGIPKRRLSFPGRGERCLHPHPQRGVPQVPQPFPGPLEVACPQGGVRVGVPKEGQLCVQTCTVLSIPLPTCAPSSPSPAPPCLQQKHILPASPGCWLGKHPWVGGLSESLFLLLVGWGCP